MTPPDDPKKQRKDEETTAAAKTGAGVFDAEMAQSPDRYADLQLRFRLRPIRHERERAQALGILAELGDGSEDAGTADYVGALKILVGAYRAL